MAKLRKPLFLIAASVLCGTLLLAERATAKPTSRASSRQSYYSKLISKRNLLALPSSANQVTRTSASLSARINAQAPTLKTISESSIKEIFWRSINGVNVIDSINSGTPDPEACKEFFSGDANGESGGLGACHLAESVGYSYRTIVRADTASCFVKSVPTKANLASGGLLVTKGSLPKGGIQQLFSPPSGETPRVVKIIGTGGKRNENDPDITYVQVASSTANKAAKKLYQANVWYCDSSETNLRGYDEISLSKSLYYTTMHAGLLDDRNETTETSGFLVADGNNFDWDASKTRAAETVNNDSNGEDFKTSLDILKSDVIKLQRVDNFDGSLSKAYQISKYSGNSAATLRFDSGAYADLHKQRYITNGIEFGSTFFSVDTGNSFLTEAQQFDLDGDFYNSSLDVVIDATKYACGTTADIEITLDRGNETIKDSVGKCNKENEDLKNMRFCHEDASVKQAELNFKNVCVDTPPARPTPRPTPPPPSKQR